MEGFCTYSNDDVPDREHVKDDREDSDNFLVLFRLVQFVNLEVSLTTGIRIIMFCQNFNAFSIKCTVNVINKVSIYRVARTAKKTHL